MLNSPPATDPIKIIIKIVPALSATWMVRFNDVGRRNGSEALRMAVSLIAVSCAIEVVGQLGCAWPCVLGGEQGGAKLSRGALRMKKVVTENSRKTRITMTIAIP